MITGFCPNGVTTRSPSCSSKRRNEKAERTWLARSFMEASTYTPFTEITLTSGYGIISTFTIVWRNMCCRGWDPSTTVALLRLPVCCLCAPTSSSREVCSLDRN